MQYRVNALSLACEIFYNLFYSYCEAISRLWREDAEHNQQSVRVASASRSYSRIAERTVENRTDEKNIMKTRGKYVIIFIKQKEGMTYYNAKKYVSSAVADLEIAFLFYLHFGCLCTFFS